MRSLVVLLALLASSTAGKCEQLLSETFSDSAQFPGTWNVIRGTVAVENGWAHGHATGQADPIFVFGDSASLQWHNITLEFDTRITSNDAWCYDRVAFYLQSNTEWGASDAPRNGYVLELRAYQNDVVLTRYVNGAAVILDRVNLIVTPGVLYHVRVVTHEGNITASVDNQPVMHVMDGTFTSGTIGFDASTGGGYYTYIDSYTDNVLVQDETAAFASVFGTVSVYAHKDRDGDGMAPVDVLLREARVAMRPAGSDTWLEGVSDAGGAFSFDVSGLPGFQAAEFRIVPTGPAVAEIKDLSGTDLECGTGAIAIPSGGGPIGLRIMRTGDTPVYGGDTPIAAAAHEAFEIYAVLDGARRHLVAPEGGGFLLPAARVVLDDGVSWPGYRDGVIEYSHGLDLSRLVREYGHFVCGVTYDVPPGFMQCYDAQSPSDYHEPGIGFEEGFARYLGMYSVIKRWSWESRYEALYTGELERNGPQQLARTERYVPARDQWVQHDEDSWHQWPATCSSRSDWEYDDYSLMNVVPLLNDLEDGRNGDDDTDSGQHRPLSGPPDVDGVRHPVRDRLTESFASIAGTIRHRLPGDVVAFGRSWLEEENQGCDAALVKSVLELFEFQGYDPGTDIVLRGPADMQVILPDGRMLEKGGAGLPFGFYEEASGPGGGDVVELFAAEAGTYLIQVLPEDGAPAKATISLFAVQHGVTFTIAEGVRVGHLPPEGFRFALSRGVVNCPYPSGFWTHQLSEREAGGRLVSGEEAEAMAAWVGAASEYFEWPPGEELTGLGSALNPPGPMNACKQARRQFATLLANVAVGQLGVVPARWDSLGLRIDARITCLGADSVGAAITRVDSMMAALEPRSVRDPETLRTYQEISQCLGAINEGIGVSPPCGWDGNAPKPYALFNRAALPGGERAGEIGPSVPNPSAGAFRMMVHVDAPGQVLAIAIYDVAGRLLRELVHQVAEPGTHEIRWDGRDGAGNLMPSGTYFCRAKVGGVTKTNRLIIVR